jgi:hypothetical protein
MVGFKVVVDDDEWLCFFLFFGEIKKRLVETRILALKMRILVRIPATTNCKAKKKLKNGDNRPLRTSTLVQKVRNSPYSMLLVHIELNQIIVHIPFFLLLSLCCLDILRKSS